MGALISLVGYYIYQKKKGKKGRQLVRKSVKNGFVVSAGILGCNRCQQMVEAFSW